MYHGFHKNIKLLSTLILKMFLDHKSCDTEDCSNDAENSALCHRNKLHLNIYSQRKQLFYIIIIFHNFYCIFDQINTAFVSRRYFIAVRLPTCLCDGFIAAYLFLHAIDQRIFTVLYRLLYCSTQSFSSQTTKLKHGFCRLRRWIQMS